MSIPLPFRLATKEIKEYIKEQCIIQTNPTDYDPSSKELFCFNVDKENQVINVPIFVASEIALKNKVSHPKINITTERKPLTIETDPKKYRDQDVVIKLIKEKLKKHGCAFAALNTGFGKTCCGTIVGCASHLKICVLVYFSEVGELWKDEFETYTDAKVQIFNSNNSGTKRFKGKNNVSATHLDPSADVYIMGIEKASHFSQEDFKDIGFLIYDEAHVSVECACTKALLKFRPKYLLGLSATPDRPDGLESLLEPYFGPVEDFIYRSETKPFTVFKYQTKYVPESSYMWFKGQKRLNWVNVKKSLEYNEERQEEICDLILSIPTVRDNTKEKVMVLGWTVEQSKAIELKLNQRLKRKIKVFPLYGSDKELFPNIRPKELRAYKLKLMNESKIIVAGLKKAGVGFNNPDITAIVLISDVLDVRQNEGRARAINCTIYDVVDKFGLLQKHWNERREWYITRGATVKYLNGDGVSNKNSEKIENIPKERMVGR